MIDTTTDTVYETVKAHSYIGTAHRKPRGQDSIWISACRCGWHGQPGEWREGSGVTPLEDASDQWARHAAQAIREAIEAQR